MQELGCIDLQSYLGALPQALDKHPADRCQDERYIPSLSEFITLSTHCSEEDSAEVEYSIAQRREGERRREQLVQQMRRIVFVFRAQGVKMSGRRLEGV